MIDIFCSAEFRDWNCKSIFMRVEDELKIPPDSQSQHSQNWTHHPSSPTTKTAPTPVGLTSASGIAGHPPNRSNQKLLNLSPLYSLSHPHSPISVGSNLQASKHSVSVVFLFFHSLFLWSFSQFMFLFCLAWTPTSVLISYLTSSLSHCWFSLLS